MKRICSWLTPLLLMVTQPALAQGRVFVSGNVFADSKLFSGEGGETVDATSVGGGGSVGLLVTERWDVRVEVQTGGTTTISQAMLPPVEAFQSRSRNRITATTALVGFHPVARPRVQFAVLAGLSFLHVRTEFDSIPVGLGVFEGTEVDNVAAPTLGVEVPITLFRQISVVPELRAIAFSLNGATEGGFAIRPGVGIRWGR